MSNFLLICFKVLSNYNYEFDTTSAYRVPKRNEYRDFVKTIQDFPNYPAPEDFSLDKNVSMTKNESQVSELLATFDALDGNNIHMDLFNNIEEDETIKKLVLMTVAEIIEKLPANFDLNVIEKKFKCSIDDERLNYVLLREVESNNEYLDLIRDSLKQIVRAYKGFAIWTKELKLITAEIHENLVPKAWLSSKKSLWKFVADLNERIKFVKHWIANGHPRSYWLGGLLSCTRFLSTMRMDFARRKRVPLDEVTFEYTVTKFNYPFDDSNPPSNSFYAYDLYLVGAKWNEQTQTLQDSRTKVIFHKMPVICFTLILKKHENAVNSFRCPLYVSPNFQDYLTTVNLPTDLPAKVWIKRGTALYCQSN